MTFSLQYVRVSPQGFLTRCRPFYQYPTGFYNLPVFRNDREDLPLPLRPTEVRVCEEVPGSSLTPTSLYALTIQPLLVQTKTLTVEKETFSVRWGTAIVFVSA